MVLLVLAIVCIGTFCLSVLHPLGAAGNVFFDIFLPVEVVFSAIIGSRLMYRFNRSVNGMPPIEFSTQHPDTARTSPVASAKVVVGFQGSVPTAGNLVVTIRVGADLLQLVEVRSMRSGYPSYEIPTSEVTSVQAANNETVIKLHDGTTIRLANYVGTPLEQVLSGEVPLTEATERFVHPDPAVDLTAGGGAQVSNFLFGFSSVVLVVVAILVTHRQWPYASGALIGSVAVDGLLWRSRHSILGAGKLSAERSPTGLKFVVVLNFVLASIFVFVSYLMKSTAITVFVLALATMMVGFSLFVLFIVHRLFGCNVATVRTAQD